MTESVVNASGPHGKEAKGPGRLRSRESVSEELIVLFFADSKKLEDPSPRKALKGLGAIRVDLASVIEGTPRLRSMFPNLVRPSSRTDKSSSSATPIAAQLPQQQGHPGLTSMAATTPMTQTSQAWGPNPWVGQPMHPYTPGTMSGLQASNFK